MRRSITSLLALATLAACTPAGAAPQEPTPREPADRAGLVVLLDADAHGAIVVDTGRREFRGVRRDGTVAWRSPQDAISPDAQRCLAICPDALLSGNPDGQDSGDAADPEPVLMIGGRRVLLPSLAGRVKRQVLSASSPADLLAVTGDGRRWWLQAGSRRIPVDGFTASWAAAADGRSGLAIAGHGGRGTAYWLTADWQAEGKPVPVNGTSACVSPDGRQALILGTRPVLMGRDGSRVLVGSLDFASDCALSSGGGIVGRYGQSRSGLAAEVEAFGPDGRRVWRAAVAGGARVSAEGDRAAVVAGGQVTEVDLRTGRISRTVPDAHAARYDGAGHLVVTDAAGTPRWLPSPA